LGPSRASSSERFQASISLAGQRVHLPPNLTGLGNSPRWTFAQIVDLPKPVSRATSRSRSNTPIDINFLHTLKTFELFYVVWRRCGQFKIKQGYSAQKYQ
jgi:hypothetical protein